MVAFHYPFEAPTLPALALRIVSAEFTPLPTETSADIAALIGALLCKDVDARPTMEEVLALRPNPIATATSPLHLHTSTASSTSPGAETASGRRPDRAFRARDAPAVARQRPDPGQRLAGARLGGAVDGGRARARRLRRRRAVAARTDVHGLLGRRLDLRRRPHRRGRHLSSGGGSGVSWPPSRRRSTPAAERETLAGYFAETGERMLCVCAVQKVGEKVTPIRASNPRRSHARIHSAELHT